MTQSLDIYVEESAEAMAQRFVDAWHRSERGEAVHEHHLSFESWKGLARVLTPRRLELLRHFRRQAAPSIAELARALGRDYKRVHADVEALAAAGLIDRTCSIRSVIARPQSGRGDPDWPLLSGLLRALRALAMTMR